jgi:hypothetical protein
MGQTHSFILCPFHGEKTASGRIFHNPLRHGIGRFKCYGCGRTARWNEVAELLGVDKWGDSKDRPAELDVPKTNTNLYKNSLLPVKTTSKSEPGEHVPDQFFDLDEYNSAKIGLKQNLWRGYPIDFLRKVIGVRILYSGKFERFYVWLPVFVNRRLKGHIKAQAHKPKSKKIPSYLNASGAWSLTHGLFPFDPAIKLMRELGISTLILVEGPRDALRLMQAGIPAMSMLGTQSWSNQKTRLLEFAGVHRLVLFLDGDDAGKNATRFLRTGYRLVSDPEVTIRPLGETFDLKIIRLWNAKIPEDHPEPKLDPGNVPDRFLNKLKRLLS